MNYVRNSDKIATQDTAMLGAITLCVIVFVLVVMTAVSKC